jgi:hypothetical protein
MVAPEERYLARDAEDLIQVDYHPLLPLLQPLEGKKDGAGLNAPGVGLQQGESCPAEIFLEVMEWRRKGSEWR